MTKTEIVIAALAAAAAIAASVMLPYDAYAADFQTTCYNSGSTRICETRDRSGHVVSKSRCYRSGRDTKCDTSTH